MPFAGTLDVADALAGAPELASLPEKAWQLPGCELLQVSFEVDEEPALGLIPPALNPSIPPYAVVSVAHYPQSPVGPFHLAQIRLVARAGIRPRAYLLQAFSDSQEAAGPLSDHWGFRVDLADVELIHRHDRARGAVHLGAGSVFEIGLEQPTILSGDELNLIDGLHLTRRAGGDGEEPLIIQVDPEYVFHYAERGEPRVESWDTEVWDPQGRLIPTYPIVAIYARCDQDLPQIRFGLDPRVENARGTVRFDRS